MLIPAAALPNSSCPAAPELGCQRSLRRRGSKSRLFPSNLGRSSPQQEPTAQHLLPGLCCAAAGRPLAAPCAGDSRMPFSLIHRLPSPWCSWAVSGFSPSRPPRSGAWSQGRKRRRKAGDYAPVCVRWRSLHCLRPSSPFLQALGCGKWGRGEERLSTFLFPQTMLLSPCQALAGLLQCSGSGAGCRASLVDSLVLM